LQFECGEPKAWACGIRPGSGARRLPNTITRAVEKIDDQASAAVTSSSSGNSACWASVIQIELDYLASAERSLMA